MGTIITLECSGQLLKAKDTPKIASGGENENVLHVRFCDSWNDYTKAAVFYVTEEERYEIALDENDSCVIPHEVTDKPGTFYIGVYGTLGDIVKTSTVTNYDVAKGIIANGTKPTVPTPDIFAKIEELSQTLVNVESQISMKPNAIIANASGDTINLSDASDSALENLKIFGKSTQNGTPSPEAPVEIVSSGDGGSVGVSVHGAQLLNLPDITLTQFGIEWNCKGGVVTAKGTSAVGGGATLAYGLNQYFPTGMTGTYYISDNNQNVMVYIRVKNANGTTSYYRNRTFTLTGTETEVVAYLQVNGGVTINETIYPMLNLGNTPIPWERYKGHILTLSTPNGIHGIPVTSGGNYTDSDGRQWISDEIDFERGVYVQRVGKLTFTGDERWAWDTEGTPYVYTSYSPVVAQGVSTSLVWFTHGKDAYISADSSTIGINLYVSGILRLRTGHSSLAETVAFIKDQYNADTPLEMVYILGTPIETALSDEQISLFRELHTNKPNTAIINDCGARMSVDYVADTKLYIDKKFDELAQAIVKA